MILNKDLHYNKLMEYGFEKFPNKRDLIILSKRWILDKNLNQEQLKDEIIAFCQRFNPEFNPAKCEDLILDTIKIVFSPEDAKKVKIEHPAELKFYDTEAQTIKNIPNIEERAVFFILMCIAKWNNTDFVYLNSSSIVNISEVFKLAHLKKTKKEQLQILFSLQQCGFIQTNIRPMLKINILGVVDGGNCYKEIPVNDNLIDFLPYFSNDVCERCGKPFNRTNNRQKYCEECARKVKNEKIAGYKHRKHEK